MYNDKRDPGGKAVYICPKCRLHELETKEGQPLSKTASLHAKDLPRSMLSNHIEERLFRRLRKEREEIAKDLSKNLGEVRIYGISLFNKFLFILIVHVFEDLITLSLAEIYRYIFCYVRSENNCAKLYAENTSLSG